MQVESTNIYFKTIQGIYMNKTVQIEYFIVFAQAA